MKTESMVQVAEPAMRFERKYRLDIRAYTCLQAALRRFTRPDGFTEAQPKQRYFIRSLYFDTFDYSAYQEKMAGETNRIKLRLRSYWAERERVAFVKAEIKTRMGNMVGKFEEQVGLDNAECFVRKNKWDAEVGSVAQEFRRLALLKNQRPVLLVDYYREAFVPMDGSDIRITFDHSLRFAAAQALFPKHAFYQSASPRIVVLEIKSKEDEPSWLEEIVRSHSLTSEPNSKYAWGIEQTQHGVFNS